MSKTQESARIDELGDIFVSVTGDDAVTESQDRAAKRSDRELPDDGGVDIEDGLDDAVDGAEVGEPDPVS
ncbi:hypothetical protein [Halomicrobium sp. LC1Hm]|uniref:hypothetical protein n=1 Tax=Halomicrobium sp. LC1Hm TaxID=2610902 RepID=UPI00129856E5|nr:hypothetical protein [Halomicrobium sp. LC1Hm]QGA83867.1 Uncharacterized protein LC1Hm_2835 [Halomicrobium sp. LC1Hm]